MDEPYPERISREAAQTNLTQGEKAHLRTMQKRLHCSSEADVIRIILRDRFKAEGLL